MVNQYDVAVVGAGVFGAWTALRLQKSGLKVALLDAYGPANSRASSGGESRIIRLGYGPDEIYTRWSARSLGLWQELFAEVGRPELFQPTGVLWLAREKAAYETATLQTLRRVGVKFAELRRDELEKRYPQFAFGDVSWAIYEPDSGVLLARRAVQAVVDEFVRRGGEFLREAVTPPFTTVSGLPVRAGTYVFACGPWLPKLFPELLGQRIRPTRQEVFFFGPPPGDKRFSMPHLPVWLDVAAEVYGFPDLETRGFKAAIDRHGPPFDPDTGE
jgi:glycine/D-amino acid oxidase-like deaminating enzyme